MQVLVTGAAGFIGQHVTERLAQDHAVRGMVFSDEQQEVVEDHCSEVVVGDVTDEDDAAAAVDGVDAVVHLVGIIEGTTERFESIHVGGTTNLVQAAGDLDRFIYISALGAETESTDYFRTKHEAESVVTGAGDPYTILRPSIVFGGDDSFITLLIDQTDSLPFAPVLGDGQYRLQPIYAGDVAEIIAQALEDEETAGAVYEIGGPGVITLEQLVDMIMDRTGTRKMKVFTPMTAARIGAPLARRFMDIPLSTTTLTMLEQESVVQDSHYTQDFDLQLHGLDELFEQEYLDGD